MRDEGELRARAGRHPLRRVAARSTPTRRSPSTCARHGDGVHDLAWLVDDADAAFDGRRGRAAPARSARRGPRPTSTATLRLGADRDLRRHRAHVRRPQPLPRPTARARLPRPTTCRRPRSAPTVGLDAHRPRRRQRRAGPARRLGALLRRGPRLRPARRTSTTTRSRTEYSALDVDRRVGRHARS